MKLWRLGKRLSERREFAVFSKQEERNEVCKGNYVKTEKNIIYFFVKNNIEPSKNGIENSFFHKIDFFS